MSTRTTSERPCAPCWHDACISIWARMRVVRTVSVLQSRRYLMLHSDTEPLPGPDVGTHRTPAMTNQPWPADIHDGRAR